MHEDKRGRERELAQAEKSLGYRIRTPAASRPLRETPRWMSDHEQPPERAAIQLIMDEEWPVASLRKQIRQLGVKPHGRSRLDLATQLAETFLDSGRLQMVMADLSEAAKDYYAQVVFNLRIPYHFEAGANRIRLLNALDAPAEQLFEEIVGAGLALEREEGFLIPQALLTRLPPIYLTVPETMRVEPRRDPQLTDPKRLVKQIQQLFGLIRSGESRLRPARYWKRKGATYTHDELPALPVPEDARRLNRMHRPQQMDIRLMAPEPRLALETLERWAEIFEGDQRTAELVYHLLRKVGVVRPGSPVALEPKYAERFLSLAPGRQIALLLDYYETLDDFDAFWVHWRLGQVQVRWEYRPYRGLYDYTFVLARALHHLRGTVLELLGLLPAETWLSFDRVVDVLEEISISGEHQIPLGAIDFVDTKGSRKGFLRYEAQAVITQLLWRLGLSDVVLDESGTLEAFRLHALQDLLWGRQRTLPMSSFSWDGKRDVRWIAEPPGLALSPPVPVGILREVQRWAEPKGVSEGALHYRLDLRRLHETFEAGETPETLVKAWEAGAETSPPRQIVAWWERWWSRYGHVQLYPRQTLLEVEDAFAMQELQVGVPILREALLARLTPQAVLLDREQTQALIAELEDKGYMPKFIATDASEEEGR